jgi:hypothetical protein
VRGEIAPKAHRGLTALLALLAFACGGLVVGWVREHRAALAYLRTAECLRSIAEEDRVPQDRECAP